MKIKVNRDEALRYLGYKGGQIHEDVIRALSDCMAELEEIARARYIYKVLNIDEVNFQGNDIAKHLDGCNKCILMAATVGMEVDELIKRRQMKDMTAAVMLDACGSSAVENACNQVETMLRAQFSEKGMFVTGRFSPGYGDMPLSQQKELCYLLDVQRSIGIYNTDSNTLIPSKSVTAVMGISNKPLGKTCAGEATKSSCDLCNFSGKCNFRKEG